MNAPTYYAPLDIATGMPCYQPHPGRTVAGWHLDRNLRYQETGFIDAPDYLPLGATQAVDCGRMTLGRAHQYREGVFA